jgi:hypothetical protein
VERTVMHRGRIGPCTAAYGRTIAEPLGQAPFDRYLLLAGSDLRLHPSTVKVQTDKFSKRSKTHGWSPERSRRTTFVVENRTIL